MKKIALALLVLCLSGCSFFKSEKTWMAGQIMEQRIDHFYHVQDEDELAILAVQNFEDGDLVICYESEQEIRPYKLYLKIKAILPVKFELETGKMQLHYENEIIESADCITIHPLESKKAVDLAVKEWANEIEYSHEKDKVVQSIHDLIVENTEYGNEKESAFQAIGVLKDHRAVCEGYSLAFNDLARAMHLHSLMINSAIINHAWNMVYVNGEWMFVDCTWDDPINGSSQISHRYCLMSLDELLQSGRYQFDENTEETLSLDEYMDFAQKVLLCFE